MIRWFNAFLILVVFIILLIIIYSLNKTRNVKTSLQMSKNEELYQYIRKYIGKSIYDYSFDKFIFKDIEVTSDFISVGGDCLLLDFLNFCVKNNIFYPIGFDYNRSISDEISKGSIGIFQRRYGLLTDYIHSMEVITSNGIFNCSHTDNPNLFWAIRGSGAENFGIISRVNFIKTKMPKYINYFDLNFPLADFENLTRCIEDKKLTKNFSACINIAKFTVNMRGIFFGKIRKLRKLLYTFPKYWVGNVYETTYGDAINLMEEYHEENTFLKNYYIKNLTQEQIKILKNSLDNIKGNFLIQLWTLGNDKLSSNSMNRGEIAIILRYTWQNDEEVDWQLDQMIALVQRLKLSTRNKCCLGFYDHQLNSHRTSYFGKRYKKIRHVKKIYDPFRVFEPVWSI